MLIPTAAVQSSGSSVTTMLGYPVLQTINIFGSGNAFGCRVWLPTTATFGNWLFRVGTSSGNMDLGVYRASDGSKVSSEGSFAVPASGRVIRPIAGGPLTLAPGEYVLFTQADNATATMALLGTANHEMVAVTPVNVFPLPSTLALTLGGHAPCLALIP